MGAAGKFLATRFFFDFSNKGGRLKQFLYGNLFSAPDAFGVSLSNFFCFLIGSIISSISRIHSDKERCLVVSGEEISNGSSGYGGEDLDGSWAIVKDGDFDDDEVHVAKKEEINSEMSEISLVSISWRYEFFSDNSMCGFIEEPKAASFVLHEPTVEEEPEDLHENCDVEKISEQSHDLAEDIAMKHVKEEIAVEFISRDGVREEDIHENCVGGEDVWKITEEIMSEEDEEFIELRPEPEISDIIDEEHEEYNDDDDDDEFGHDDVIERLKMEMRSARTGGLATILEESETPLEEPKPLKIDSRFELKDKIAEIHKVYQSYTIKMRKLDVLNSQTMHSISLIKLRDSNSKEKAFREIKRPVRKNLWPFKRHQYENDDVDRLVRDATRDLETVYVGHLCLSWEILHWQYLKVLEFHQHDPEGTCQYNLVADEFQLFQVLLQRFVENEPFQGCPRIENYLKNRRCFLNFLQVPFVRDDRSSSKTNRCRNEGEFAITIEMLRDIIQESIRIFWEFISIEEHEFNSNLKVSHQTQVSPQEPLDLELLTDIRSNLQKKEKRLKEIVRSQACMVNKLKKKKTKGRSGEKHEVMIAQVELRLVSRVTTMAKLTSEQLAWCDEKLKRISFCGRRIQLDPSFSLFPC